MDWIDKGGWDWAGKEDRDWIDKGGWDWAGKEDRDWIDKGAGTGQVKRTWTG